VGVYNFVFMARCYSAVPRCPVLSVRLSATLFTLVHCGETAKCLTKLFLTLVGHVVISFSYTKHRNNILMGPLLKGALIQVGYRKFAIFDTLLAVRECLRLFKAIVTFTR